MSPELRISDAEREQAVSALGEHYLAGRLTKEEYDERAAAAWQARTASALWPLFADLPALQQTRLMPAPAPRSPRRSRRRLPVLPLLVLGFVILVVAHVPWWAWILLFWLWCTGIFAAMVSWGFRRVLRR